MTDRCETCGYTRREIEADAKTLGLLEEFQAGLHRCCDIVRWADEQWLAWFDAEAQDANEAGHRTDSARLTEEEPALVPIRSRRPPQSFRNA
jgi:hypothetical protein